MRRGLGRRRRNEAEHVSPLTMHCESFWKDAFPGAHRVERNCRALWFTLDTYLTYPHGLSCAATIYPANLSEYNTVSLIINLLRFIVRYPSSSRHLTNLPPVNAVVLESSTSVVFANMYVHDRGPAKSLVSNSRALNHNHRNRM